MEHLSPVGGRRFAGRLRRLRRRWLASYVHDTGILASDYHDHSLLLHVPEHLLLGGNRAEQLRPGPVRVDREVHPHRGPCHPHCLGDHAPENGGLQRARPYVLDRLRSGRLRDGERHRVHARTEKSQPGPLLLCGNPLLPLSDLPGHRHGRPRLGGPSQIAERDHPAGDHLEHGRQAIDPVPGIPLLGLPPAGAVLQQLGEFQELLGGNLGHDVLRLPRPLVRDRLPLLLVVRQGALRLFLRRPRLR
mmetsp:Transcript_23328/g.55167  ORF Transcript_23328/g.55167 Transcript_23328/m.55167 type:complete len:247 (+) Transcript_23328:611-1351(+)